MFGRVSPPGGVHCPITAAAQIHSSCRVPFTEIVFSKYFLRLICSAANSLSLWARVSRSSVSGSFRRLKRYAPSTITTFPVNVSTFFFSTPDISCLPLGCSNIFLPNEQPDKTNKPADNTIAINLTALVYLVLSCESTDYERCHAQLSGNVRQIK